MWCIAVFPSRSVLAISVGVGIPWISRSVNQGMCDDPTLPYVVMIRDLLCSILATQPITSF